MKFNFDNARKDLFKSGYTQLQVDSINAIIKEAVDHGVKSKNQLAYILATAYHEAFDFDGKTTGKIQRLVPIKEKGSMAYLKAKKYYPYIGYGFVQLTWEANFRKYAPKVQSKFGVDIMKTPDLLLRIDIASFVIVEGMLVGGFTGKKLSDYITNTKTDFVGARRIVNSLDKASLIAGYANQFLKHIG